MGDISQMSQEELSTMLNELQASRENWMAENLLSTEMSDGSQDLQIDSSIAVTFPDTAEGDAMRAAYSRRFNNSLNSLKEKSKFDIPGYISTEIYANVKDQREEVKKKIEKSREKTTVLDLTIGEIIKNTVMTIVNFQKDIHYHIYKVELEERMNETGNEDEVPFKNFKNFMLAFFNYLNENDNMLYFGFILMFLSIILYLFNILRE
uniref:Uncharacterized protein n=1 Tax=viral metagenome TaxID=1070528 RepID=A0A6C0F7A0_9ZZZZ|tara:strand:+ start:15415 stop:16035 length:621 start_codon:yes stop_codon:yes gene_type:complete